jgi:hypothetical protein
MAKTALGVGGRTCQHKGFDQLTAGSKRFGEPSQLVENLPTNRDKGGETNVWGETMWQAPHAPGFYDHRYVDSSTGRFTPLSLFEY